MRGKLTGEEAAKDESDAAGEGERASGDARDAHGSSSSGVSRRGFLGAVVAGAGAAAATGLAGCGSDANAQIMPSFVPATPLSPPTETPQARRARALQVRVTAAEQDFDRGVFAHPDNGDEALYDEFFTNYSKALPHDARGVVDRAAYEALRTAARTESWNAFERVPIAGQARLTSPQSGIAYSMAGYDSHTGVIPPAPAFASAEEAGEMVELYWLALARDVPFSQYDTDPIIAAAAQDLSRLSDFRGPKQNGAVTPATIFRGSTPGDLAGPYISQFLLQDFAYGSLPVVQRQRTLVPGVDYLTDWDGWLAVQNGGPAPMDRFDPVPRYIRNARDMGYTVKNDVIYQEYLNAALVLMKLNVAKKPGANPYASTPNQMGFATFGPPHLAALIGKVAIHALCAVWYQKWCVHRRLRPEEFGGRVEATLSRRATFPLHADLMNSAVIAELQRAHGTALLPMAYPEGCPTHPSYGAGHATAAGACVTLLKAWFDEDAVIPNPVVASADGTSLVPYTGPDAGQITVGNELNKLAANVGIGRNAAGVHWRSDYWESAKFGEQVALGLLAQLKSCYAEPAEFVLTTFEGQRVVV